MHRPVLVTVIALLGTHRVDADPCRLHAFDLAPDDVGSQSSSVFTTLPSANPARFGLTGTDVRVVNFDRTPSGAKVRSERHLTNEYAKLGVKMNGIRVSDSVWEGAASGSNATWNNAPQIFTFTVPTFAVGIVNTSPDQNLVQLWSGPNATGRLLLEFTDGSVGSYDDRFVGGRVCGEVPIGSMKVVNREGKDLELDELVFEVWSSQPRVAIQPARR